MTENEKKARAMLKKCIANNVNPIDFTGKLVLTNEECMEIAKNFPYSYKQIRWTFNKK